MMYCLPSCIQLDIPYRVCPGISTAASRSPVRLSMAKRCGVLSAVWPPATSIVGVTSIAALDGGMATEAISSQDTFIEDKGADDVGMTTEPIDLSADLTDEVDEEEIEEVDSPAARQPRQRRAAVAAEPQGNPAMTFALVVACIVGMLALYSAWNTANNEGETGLGDMATKIAGWGFFTDQEAIDKDIRAQTQDIKFDHNESMPDSGSSEGCGE